MRHIPENRRNELARHFEQTCFSVFSCLMPQGAKVRATWAHGGAEALYTGSLYKKMCQVAADLRCTANFKERDFKRNDSGDGGIDLISWHPMADERPGLPISFAQCGCSKSDWRFKHLEASPAKHGSHLPVAHPWKRTTSCRSIYATLMVDGHMKATLVRPSSLTACGWYGWPRNTTCTIAFLRFHCSMTCAR